MGRNETKGRKHLEITFTFKHDHRPVMIIIRFNRLKTLLINYILYMLTPYNSEVKSWLIVKVDQKTHTASGMCFLIKRYLTYTGAIFC